MIKIQDEPVRIEDVLAAVADEAHGAHMLFLGVVRNLDKGREVEAVTYDCFRPLAQKELALIAREASERFGVRIAAVHRLGRLGVGETSLAVAAASPHRDAAFAASRWVVDEIKRRLPVWKKEHYAGGDAHWLEGCGLIANG